MKYLKISNNGEIDSMAFELIGASSKRGDNTKIGQFGSGLKYAVAYLLRSSIPFKVFSGETEVIFDKRIEQFRDKVFERILVDGRDTSYTTDMGGVDWETWMVIREIWCNALDETGEEMQVVSGIENGAAGRTTIYINLVPEVEQVVEDWDLYFCNRRSDLIEKVNGISVFSGGEDLIIYRKGIRCFFKKGVKCAFHYDLDEIDINESRIVSEEWELKHRLTTFWIKKPSVNLIKRLARVIVGKYEFDLYWDHYGYQMNNLWAEALDKRLIVEHEQSGHYTSLLERNNVIQLPKSLAGTLMNKFENITHIGGKEGTKGIQKLKPTEKQEYMLNKAEEFFTECDYSIKYPIQVCRFNVKGTLGMASYETIFISEDAFESLHLLIQVLIEENEHCVTGLDDETRAFQDHLIKLFLEEKIKRFAYVI